jgi:hypothetical protein
MLQDDFKMIGRLSIAVNDEVVQEIPNLVVTDGKEFVASRMKDATTTAMSHMAVGTGSTAAAAGDSALGSEAERNALTSTTVSGADITYVATFAAGEGTGALTEAGLFNASSSGDMLCRTVFPVVNKGQNDQMSVTWTVTVS